MLCACWFSLGSSSVHFWRIQLVLFFLSLCCYGSQYVHVMSCHVCHFELLASFLGSWLWIAVKFSCDSWSFLHKILTGSLLFCEKFFFPLPFCKLDLYSLLFNVQFFFSVVEMLLEKSVEVCFMHDQNMWSLNQPRVGHWASEFREHVSFLHYLLAISELLTLPCE